jgi:prepilin-type N-terminal cleavage/methylation domain-containing protein
MKFSPGDKSQQLSTIRRNHGQYRELRSATLLKSTIMRRSLRFVRGFSLIEMTVVLVVAVLLLGGLLVPLSTQVEQRKLSDTEKSLEEAKEALVGFALANGYLPCPAISFSNGLENRSGASCASGTTGSIPWATLGVNKLDSWGHIIRYSVSPAFTNSSTKFTLSTARTITVQSRDATGTPVNLSNSNDVPAIVVSHGKNGYGSFNDNGVAQAGTAGADENQNATGPSAFWSRVQTENTAAAGGAFDDIVAWISANTLFNRMVAAGKLP